MKWFYSDKRWRAVGLLLLVVCLGGGGESVGELKHSSSSRGGVAERAQRWTTRSTSEPRRRRRRGRPRLGRCRHVAAEVAGPQRMWSSHVNRRSSSSLSLIHI